MSIRAFENKKGVTYEVRFVYKDRYGRNKYYSKRGFESRKKAERHEKLMRAKMLNGYESKKKMTLDDVFQEFIQNSGLKKSSLSMKITRYKCHIKPKIGGCEIEKIDYKIIYDLASSKKNLSKNTIATIMATLKSILVYAYNNHYIDRMPYLSVKYEGKENESKNKIITDEMFESLISKSEYEHQIAYYIARYTGCRLGEVLALEWNDIDFTNDTIRINKSLYYNNIEKQLEITSTKTETSNSIIPLAKPLKTVLMEHRKHSRGDIVVNDNGNYIYPYIIQNRLVKYSQRNEHINFHMFRHTYTTTLFNNGIDPKTAQRLLRHKSFNTTMSVYTHISDESLKDRIDNIFN